MNTPLSRRGARIAAFAALATVASPLALTATAAPQLQVDETRKAYIVQLDEAPVASYEGGTKGIPATKPAPGQKVKAASGNAKAYEAHLRNEQRKALRAAGLSEERKTHEYTVALNGFAAELTSSEAAQLAKAPGVVNVWEDEIRYADTVTTPDYLGMTGEDGVWAEQFGGTEDAGEGVVVGVIDTGIDPGNPSFAPIGNHGRGGSIDCENENDRSFKCTDKIVGARWYGTDYGNNTAYDFESPRDTNGHGSHTAGTAAGNHGVPMTVQGNDLGEGSGMAPAAQIAVYKALWQTADGRGSGTSTGLVAAIDDAVADGVDVINYSVSGSSTYVVTADELAFLGAASAGVFVSTSAGNSGDSVGVSSVAHNSPWTMTVAASTHDRGVENTLTLGNGTELTGVGFGGPLGATALVLAEEVGAEGAEDSELCAPGSLDDAKTSGKLVVCDRGAYALVDKAAEVSASGGAGMVLVNVPGGAASQNAILYGLPATHLTAEDGTTVKSYVEADGTATGALSESTITKVDAPEMASFSSYGPALAGGGDLLKPDITAPGADVLAAVNEDPKTGKAQFDLLSGTSMSAPHIAGLGALLKDKYPSWSPMAIKSAMMTTARQTTDGDEPIMRGSAVATPLNYGAGEVVPGESYNPGLVYDSNVVDWYSYACSIEQLELVYGSGVCDVLPEIDPSDLNYPSIAVGDLAGSQTVTRTVTNVTDESRTYTASIETPAGTEVQVEPSSFTIDPGATQSFTLSIERTDAPLGEYTFGAITWTTDDAGVNAVRSPIAVRPVALAAPGEVVGSGTDGSTEISVTPGFSGTLGTDVDGLAASTVSAQDVVRNPDTTLDALYELTIPEGTKVLRFATYDDEVEAADIDLNVYHHNGKSWVPVGSSGGGTSQEEWTSTAPAAGAYIVAVDLYSNEASASVPVHTFAVSDDAVGNLTVSPESAEVTQGTATTLTASWSGLDAGQRYLGQVNFLEGTSVAGSTLVTVNP